MESKGAWTAKLDRMRRNAQARAKKLGVEDSVRSGLELQVSVILKHFKVPYTFEAEQIKFVSQPENHTYTPDFRITTESGKVIFIETKGRMEQTDRKKHLWIKAQHPDLDIRFVFSKPNAWDRAAKTRSYAKWADANGFKWCSKMSFKTTISKWLKE